MLSNYLKFKSTVSIKSQEVPEEVGPLSEGGSTQEKKFIEKYKPEVEDLIEFYQDSRKNEDKVKQYEGMMEVMNKRSEELTSK